jgi:hypothetical protein
MRNFVRHAAILLLVFLLTACAKSGQQEPRADQPPSPPPSPPAEYRGSELFPETDWQITYSVQDHGQKPVTVVEELIREGDRLVATYNGQPYVTWVLGAEGVWRTDPRGGGALLRFLPPTLKHNEAWKQQSGDAEVWFKLAEKVPCSIWRTTPPKHCWDLTVLNRGERTVFQFVSTLGPYHVQADNYQRIANSFTKQIKEHKEGAIDPGMRAALLKQVPAAAGTPAAVIPVTPAEFDQAESELGTKKS